AQTSLARKCGIVEQIIEQSATPHRLSDLTTSPQDGILKVGILFIALTSGQGLTKLGIVISQAQFRSYQLFIYRVLAVGLSIWTSGDSNVASSALIAL
ncbi:hypothetical protein, partial [Vibrio anguillarum]|uniref:hypothetical protein n=2 Tax=Vibrio anguillarum TaxID=55601 RepID=UPI001BE4CEB8